MSFGLYLRTLRGEAKLSRAELAGRAGVPVSTLRNWASDWGFPGTPVFPRLAEALGFRWSGWQRGWKIWHKRTRSRARVKHTGDGRGVPGFLVLSCPRPAFHFVGGQGHEAAF